jgi:hypothetical protein
MRSAAGALALLALGLLSARCLKLAPASARSVLVKLVFVRASEVPGRAGPCAPSPWLAEH